MISNILKPIEKNHGLTNAYEQCVFFGMFNNETQLNPVQSCRGYMMEDLAACIKGEDVGKNWKRETSPSIVGEDCGIIAAAARDVINKRLPVYEDFFTQLDLILGMEPTQFVHVEAIKTADVYKVYLDEKYYNAPFLISFITLCIRTLARPHIIGQDIYKTFDEIIKVKEQLRVNRYPNIYKDIDKRFHKLNQGDITDFTNSYDLIKKIMKYGIEPFIFPNRKKNYLPRYRAHYFGLAGLCSNYVHDYRNRRYGRSSQYKYAHRFENDEQIKAWFVEEKRKKDELAAKIAAKAERERLKEERAKERERKRAEVAARKAEREAKKLEKAKIKAAQAFDNIEVKPKRKKVVAVAE